LSVATFNPSDVFGQYISYTAPIILHILCLGEFARIQAVSKTAATKAKTATATPLQAVADEVAASVPPPELQALIEAIQKSGQTPRDLDRLLLGKSRTRLGADLDSTQKKEVRTFFLAACERLHQKLR
jgi:hypothetical protein